MPEALEKRHPPAILTALLEDELRLHVEPSPPGSPPTSPKVASPRLLARRSSPASLGKKKTMLLWNQFVFLATGLISTLGGQWLHYKGAADGRSMLTILATYIGMVTIHLLPEANSQRRSEPTIAHKSVLCVAFMDVLGNVVLTIGQFSVGSGLFQVIYASMVVFTAFLSRIFLKRTLNGAQWLAVFLIMMGLSINATGGSDPEERTSDAKVVAGFFITLMGTCIYSGVYTLNDYLLSNAAIPMAPRQQCFWVGLYSGIICLVLMLFSSIPTLREMPLNDSGVIGMYLVLVISSLGHNLTYFELLESTGAVATGVLQALRAVLVFGLSHLMFCQRDTAQCFTAQKGMSTLVVVAGVVGFSVAKAVGGSNKTRGEFSRVPDGSEHGEDIDMDDVGKPKK
ncbi:hypothetical protein SpCBS45565_g00014 [Spizellomyces sp. 'palustris']|nr:hypothetical protein SpCBS45565_g00014 [Spizellomyces sp. 'palustris']